MPSVTTADSKTNKYPTVAAESILKSLQTLGFGDIQPKSGKGRESLCFRKKNALKCRRKLRQSLQDLI